MATTQQENINQLTKQLEFTQSTNQLLMKNQTMMQDMINQARSNYETTIQQLKTQLQVFSQQREQDRKTLSAIQLARQQDQNEYNAGLMRLKSEVSEIKKELETLIGGEDPKL